jgi:hypothetical protein
MISPEEKKDNNDAWRSCCFTLDKGCIAYFSQLIFSLSTLSFCAIMLIKANGECNQSSPYINIISFMLGKILSSVLSSKD